MTYSEAMEYINYTNTLGSVPGLDTIKELLRRLGSPQDDVRVIHISGTNGKGSICAFLDEILENSRYTVGRYISPTIFTYLERFQMNKKYMSEDEFAVYLERVKLAADAMVSEGMARPTSFETETAVAFCYFKDMDVDFLLLETGMGGELDATNVCAKPLCTVIAGVSMDHMAFLGDTLTDIYRHKLGIMREGVPCVSYQVDDSLLSLWFNKCENMGLNMVKTAKTTENINAAHGSMNEDVACVGTIDIHKNRHSDTEKAEESCTGCAISVMTDFSEVRVTRNTRDDIVYTYRGSEYRLSAAGEYQIYNSVVAIETAFVLRQLGYDISSENIQRGIAETYWRGRFQKLSEEPMIYADGAHNVGGWHALRKNIDNYFKKSDIIYVCGVFKDKEYGKMLDIMMPRASAFMAVQPDSPRALPADELAKCAKKYIDSVYVQKDALAAVEQAKRLCEGLKEPVIVIFGSLSFIGSIIEEYEG